MKFTSTIAALATIGSAVAGLIPNGQLKNPFSPIPGYPIGNGLCLTDQQAQFIVNAFKTILTAQDRQVANATAQTLIADGYVEESDSINILAGYPLGGPSFSGKQTYVTSVVYAPAIPEMDTLDMFHDCTHVAWHWNVPHLGMNKFPVKGMNHFTVTNPAKGTVIKSDLEFSSMAWGQDIGWTCSPPAGGQSQ